MANALRSAFKNALSIGSLSRLNNLAGIPGVYAPSIRPLYSRATLGVDEFMRTREKIKTQLSNIADKFKTKMDEYVTDESKSMVFTEDLKNMIHLADDDKDVDLVVEMMKKYNKQNKSMRFGNYVFGPVVMRMFYIHKKADLAFECFTSPDLVGFFDQYMSYQILCDLLYESQKYKEILQVLDTIKAKQFEGAKFPKNVVVLALAACYKMNTPESLDYALQLWGELRDVGHAPMRRATTFCAKLALNQGRPDLALEILTNARNPGYTTVRNLKVAALAEIGRLEELIPILKSVLREDNPQGHLHTFNRDVLESVKKAVAAAEIGDISAEFNRILELLQKQGQISDMTIDEQLCQEIQPPPMMNNRDYSGQDRRQQRYQQRPFQQRRPGLQELV